MRSILTRFTYVAAIAVISIMATSALARTWSSEMHRCELTFPDDQGWTPIRPDYVPDGQGLLKVVKTKARKAVVLNLHSVTPWFAVTDPDYLTGLKLAAEDGGATVMKAGLAMINDLDVCYVLAEKEIDDMLVSVLECAIAKDEKLFILRASKADGSAMDDDELASIVHSFKIREFDTPDDALRMIPPGDVF